MTVAQLTTQRICHIRERAGRGRAVRILSTPPTPQEGPFPIFFPPKMRSLFFGAKIFRERPRWLHRAVQTRSSLGERRSNGAGRLSLPSLLSSLVCGGLRPCQQFLSHLEMLGHAHLAMEVADFSKGLSRLLAVARLVVLVEHARERVADLGLLVDEWDLGMS